MRPLRYDREQPPWLRSDLLRSQSAGRDYPVHAQLAQLRAALADTTPWPLAQRFFASAGRGVQPLSWKLLTLFALGAAGIVIGLQPRAAQERRLVDGAAELQPFAAATAQPVGAPPPAAAIPAVPAMPAMPDPSAREATASAASPGVLAPRAAREGSPATGQ